MRRFSHYSNAKAALEDEGNCLKIFSIITKKSDADTSFSKYMNIKHVIVFCTGNLERLSENLYIDRSIRIIRQKKSAGEFSALHSCV
jgi:hypothetical protein